MVLVGRRGGVRLKGRRGGLLVGRALLGRVRGPVGLAACGDTVGTVDLEEVIVEGIGDAALACLVLYVLSWKL